jgi:glycosyltransferase involved in cell wall biosynthesis
MARGTAAAAVAEGSVTCPSGLERLEARGKFLFRGTEKHFLRGVSYGPFSTGSHGAPFPERDTVRRDFALLRDLGANCIRTFTHPPAWLLDLAAESDLGVFAGLAWTQHVCFLDDPEVSRSIRAQVTEAAKTCAGHPAISALLIGNEIPPDIVRWHGPDRVRDFLSSLYDLVKTTAPGTLMSYANFPPTEYLDLDFLDFVSFNVYLHREADFCHYLSRLQNLSGDRPLVLTEIGIDALREGAENQAQTLDWQVRSAFESGVAGTIIFSWTDDWFTGGAQIEDWSFGLVDRARAKKPAYYSVQRMYAGALPPALPDPPRISVVICAFNAERTMEACLASLRTLRYPNYEVIVVNDGSTDRTLEIAQRYEEVRLISQPNRGLSAARNVGFEHATGTIVAYTDSDCVVDPDWLTYLAYKFVHGGFVAVGGPNLPPPEDGRVPACVAAAPGGPTHVLLDDEVAEHIPGCNMAFLKSVLVDVGGFDPIHRAAGDDVDLCWRLQNAGHVIGFSPAAMVWHFRRNTIKAYLKQQMGYGKAEAQLYFKHPFRFNMLGQSQWIGRIYGDLEASLFSPRPVIYHGVFGRGMFQTLYEPSSSLLAHLPFTLEWNLVGIVLLMGALIGGRYELIASIPLLFAVGAAARRAWRAKLEPRYEGIGSRLLIAALIYLGPLVRTIQRYLHRIQGMTGVARIQFVEPSQAPRVQWWQRQFFLSFWSEQGLEKENLLHALMEFLVPRRYLITIDQGWSERDVTAHRGLWSKADIEVAVENHGGPKRLFRVRCRVRESVMTRWALPALAGVAIVAAAAGWAEVAVLAGLLGVLYLGVVISDGVQLGRLMYQVIEIVAKQIGLGPTAGKTAS